MVHIGNGIANSSKTPNLSPAYACFACVVPVLCARRATTRASFPFAISTTGGKINNLVARSQSRVVVARKGPCYVFSPWEVPDRARHRDVYASLAPRVCSSSGAFCEGVDGDPF